MKKTILSLSCLLMTASAYSADLSEVFSQSQQHDPQLSAAKHTLNASKEGKKQALSIFLPQVSSSWSTGTENSDTTTNLSDEVVTSDNESRGWSVTLNQSIYDHSNYLNYKISDMQIIKSETDYENTYQSFVLRVAQNYFDVLGAKDSLVFSKAEEKAIQRQLDQAEQRFEVGLAAITDVHEARARFDNSRAAVILADNVLQDANEALFEMTQKYYTELSPVPNDLDFELFELETLESYQEMGLKTNPELLSTRIAKDIAEKQISVKKAAHYPTVSLSLTNSRGFAPGSTRLQVNPVTGNLEPLETGDTTTKTNRASLSVSLPIYSGGNTSSVVRQFAHQYNAELDKYEQTLRSTTRKIRNAYHGTIAAKSTVNARKLAMVSAQSGLEATEAGYEVGTRTIVDVLNSQQNLYQAQRDYSKAKYDYFIQYLGLKQASGNLNENDILTINKILS